MIINAHIKGLVKISAVSIDNDLRCLGLLCDQVEAHVQALQALEINSESYGKLLILSLVEKLPPNMPLIISRDSRSSICGSWISQSGNESRSLCLFVDE